VWLKVSCKRKSVSRLGLIGARNEARNFGEEQRGARNEARNCGEEQRGAGDDNADNNGGCPWSEHSCLPIDIAISY
jgi:hypothetical protein